MSTQTQIVSQDLSELVAEIQPDDLKGLRVTFINMPLRENALPTN